MKRLALASLFSLLALPAFAATLSCSVTAGGSANTVLTKTITAPDATRLVNWAISLRAGSIVQTPAVPAVPAVLDGNGAIVTPAVAAVPAVMRDPTPAEAVNFLFQDALAGWVNAEAAKASAAAAQTAAGTITPINPQ